MINRVSFGLGPPIVGKREMTLVLSSLFQLGPLDKLRRLIRMDSLHKMFQRLTHLMFDFAAKITGYS